MCLLPFNMSLYAVLMKRSIVLCVGCSSKRPDILYRSDAKQYSVVFSGLVDASSNRLNCAFGRGRIIARFIWSYVYLGSVFIMVWGLGLWVVIFRLRYSPVKKVLMISMIGMGRVVVPPVLLSCQEQGVEYAY